MRNPSMRWFVVLVPLVLSTRCASQASRTLAPYKQTAKQADSAAAWYEYGAAAIALFTTGPGINFLQAAFLNGWDMSLNDMVEVYVECLDIWKKMVKVEERNVHV